MNCKQQGNITYQPGGDDFFGDKHETRLQSKDDGESRQRDTRMPFFLSLVSKQAKHVPGEWKHCPRREIMNHHSFKQSTGGDGLGNNQERVFVLLRDRNNTW
jgi:hypothetical protein